MSIFVVGLIMGLYSDINVTGKELMKAIIQSVESVLCRKHSMKDVEKSLELGARL